MTKKYPTGLWLICRITGKDVEKWHQVVETIEYPDESIGIETNHTKKTWVDETFFNIWKPEVGEFFWSIKYKSLVKCVSVCEDNYVTYLLSDGGQETQKLEHFHPFNDKIPEFIQNSYSLEK